ncbi:MAG: hypothetical protein HY862_18855 [Chloroflexi bacterium]|nr:hypothetical protein [Chloroflexota bacterium]
MSLDPIVKHRRDFRRKIVLPIALSALGMIFLLFVLPLILVATDTISKGQIATVSSVLLVICILVPLVLVFLVLDVLFIMLAYGSAKIPAKIYGPLQSVRRLVQRTSSITIRAADKINQPMLAVNVRLARWEYFIGHLLGLSKKPPEERPPTSPPQAGQP